MCHVYACGMHSPWPYIQAGKTDYPLTKTILGRFCNPSYLRILSKLVDFQQPFPFCKTVVNFENTALLFPDDCLASQHMQLKEPHTERRRQEPLWVTAEESRTAHAFEALYQNLMLSLTDLHTTMVCLICFFIKSIMGLIEKIGSATCHLSTDLSVCRLTATSRISAYDTCVIGELPLLMRAKTNINTGGAPAPIDHYAMRINHLAFISKNKIYICNVWNVSTRTLAPSTSGNVSSGAHRAPFRCVPLDIWTWLCKFGARF